MELVELMEYAYENTEHYRSLFDGLGLKPRDIRTPEDLKKLPVLTKDQIQRDPERFVPREYTRFPKINNIQLRRSYRPEGIYLKTYWDSEDDKRAQEPLWRLRREWYGIDETMRCVTFHGNIYRGNKIFEPKEEFLEDQGRTLSLSSFGLEDEVMRVKYEKILTFNPEWISMPSSVALIFADYIGRMKYPLPTCLKYIEVCGNINIIEISKKLKLSCSILLETQETGPIALSDQNGILRIIEGNTLLELESNDKLLITGLKNFAMPLIRYDIGYYGAIIESNSALTVTGPCDEVVLSDERNTRGSELAAVVELTNEFMGCPIKRFSFQRVRTNSFRAIFTLKPAFVGWKRAVEQEFRQNLKKLGIPEEHWMVAILEDDGLPVAGDSFCKELIRHE